MPRRPNTPERLEAFCDAVARGMSGTQAAIAAGYSTPRASATAAELRRRPEVQTRIDELKERYVAARVEKVTVTGEWVMQELAELALRAKELNDRPTLARTLEILARANGLFIERRMEVRSPLESMSAHQLQRLLTLLQAVEDGSAVPQVLDSDQALTAAQEPPRLLPSPG
ncbi:MAG: terminase small subunit [Burkholderiales bacterium]|nr:terminase small subunit [Burkholderiales bacterium]